MDLSSGRLAAPFRELARGHVLQGKYFDSVKHLGFLSSGRGDLRDERLARITSVRTAWYTFHRFWHAACPLRVKIIMLKCLVYEAAVSGWTAAAPNKHDTAAIDSIVLCSARKLLRERALRQKLSQSGALVGYSKVDDKSVWRLVRCVPVATELRVRRLKWWCTIARDLRTHCCITATIFDTYDFENRGPISWHETPPSHDSPWVKQLWNDLQEIKPLVDGSLIDEDFTIASFFRTRK